MKAFVTLSIDYERPNETGVVVFVAENKDEAVLAVAEDILGPDEIADFVENGESGDEISDFINIWMLDEYPVVIAEFATPMKSYVDAKSLDLEFWYSSDVLSLLDKKYPKKK